MVSVGSARGVGEMQLLPVSSYSFPAIKEESDLPKNVQEPNFIVRNNVGSKNLELRPKA